MLNEQGLSHFTPFEINILFLSQKKADVYLHLDNFSGTMTDIIVDQMLETLKFFSSLFVSLYNFSTNYKVASWYLNIEDRQELFLQFKNFQLFFP